MDNRPHIIIIGSGVGGLSCGAILSREGYRITVIEMNKQIGGILQTFVRDRHIFDSGVHYVGGLDKGQNLYKIFKFLGIVDKLKMERMDETFDRLFFHRDGKEYGYSQGYPNFISTLVKDFPEEKDAIEKYCDAIKSTCKNFPLYNLQPGEFFDKPEFLETDTKAFISTLTKNKRLQNVLAGNNALYAGEANKTPFYVHALVLNSYIESSWRFVDGGSQIAKHLVRIILSNGGEVKNRTEIKKIYVKNDKIECAESSDGRKFYADFFISSIHPAKTLEMTDTDLIRPAYRHRINSLENSLSAFVLNITLKPKSFKYQNCNYYCFLQDDVWTTMNHTDETWPLGYALFFSGMPKNTEYAEGITAMAYMKFSEVEKWKHTYNTVAKPSARGSEYEEFTKRKSEKLIDCVSKKFPELKKAIHAYYCSTPLTFRDYMGTHDGSLYGIVKDFREPLKTFISPRTKIENLFLTGQNIKLHGVLGVAISSLVTCSVFIDMNTLLSKIEDA